MTADGTRIASGHEYGKIKIWDGIRGGDALLTLGGHEHEVTSLAYSKDGQRLYSAGGDGTIRVWDAAVGGNAIIVLRGHRGRVWQLAITSDNRRIFSGGEDGCIRIWDALRGNEALSTIDAHPHAEIKSLFLSHDSSMLATGAMESGSGIKVWNVGTTVRLMTSILSDHADAIALTGDGERIVSASRGLIKIWNARQSGAELLTLGGHEPRSGVSCLALCSDPPSIISGGGDGTIRIWYLAPE